ncbi:MAG: TIGR03084 family metal-binding protein [Acidimicrobiales bacterium]
MTVAEIAADLRAEQQALDEIVAPLTDAQWTMPTPSPGWTVADQIAHLTYFDDTATSAVTDPERFAADTAELLAALAGGSADMDEATLSWSRAMAPADLLRRWRTNRARLLDAADTLAEDARVPWYGPSMGAKSFLTARLMETWAHGQDVADAVGVARTPTDRLRHIAQLGVITHTWTYLNRGLDAPSERVRVELIAPSGQTWSWNDEATGGRVRGPVEDFCLVVTQRRHVDDTALVTEGASARDWMEKAQAFAGGATEGPAPRP